MSPEKENPSRSTNPEEKKNPRDVFHCTSPPLSRIIRQKIFTCLKKKTKKLIYIIPFFNRLDIYHTNGWTSSNYVEFYNKYLGRQPDYIIVNTNYKRTLAGQEWVINDLESYDNTVVVKGNLLSTTYSSKKTHCPKTTSNKVVRSPIGFDNKKMLKVLSNIMK